jgi:hypothetical protein
MGLGYKLIIIFEKEELKLNYFVLNFSDYNLLFFDQPIGTGISIA